MIRNKTPARARRGSKIGRDSRTTRIRSLRPIKGIDFLITLGVLFIVSSSIHEYGHLVTLRVLGGKGAIDSGVLNGVRMIEPTRYPQGNIFVAFMGGWSSAAIFTVIWALSEDPEVKVSSSCIITYQFIYGQFEGFWYATGDDGLLMVGVVAGVVVMFLVMLNALFRRAVIFRCDQTETKSNARIPELRSAPGQIDNHGLTRND